MPSDDSIQRANAAQYRHRWARFAGLALAGGYAALRLAPWAPELISDRPDLSFQAVLHDAFAQSRQFGSEMVVPYGPWGFLLAPSAGTPAAGPVGLFDPATYPTFLLARLALAAVLTWACWPLLVRLACRCHTAVAGLAWLLAVEVLAQNDEAYFYAFAFLLMCRAATDGWSHATANWAETASSGPTDSTSVAPVNRQRTITDLLLALAVALVALTKLNFLLVGSLAAVGAALIDLAAKRPRPVLLPTYLAGLALFWLLAGQSLTAIPRFIAHQAEFARGYAPALGVIGSDLAVQMFALVAVCLIVLAAWVLSSAWRVGALSAIAFAAITAVVLATAGFRQDAEHTQRALLAWAFQSSVVAAWAIGDSRRLLSASTAGLALLLVGLATLALWWPFHEHPDRQPSPLATTQLAWQRQLDGLAATCGWGEPWAERHARQVRELQAIYPMAHFDLTTDLYPDALGALLPQTKAYAPRPTAQSAWAYTPALASLNAKHLSTARAAELVWFDVMPRGERFPSLADSPSWLELLRWYEPVGGSNRYTLLNRLTYPRDVLLRPMNNVVLGWGELTNVPSATPGPVWVSVEVTPTARWPALSRHHPLVMEATFDDGQVGYYRLNPQTAAEGFLLSPLIDSGVWFAWLASTPWATPEWQAALHQRRIRSIGFHVLDDRLPPRDFEPLLMVNFSRLELAPAGDLPLAFRVEQLPAVEFARSDEPSQGNRLMFQTPDRVVFLSAPYSRRLLPLPGYDGLLKSDPKRARAEVDFGIIEQAWLAEAPVGRAEFRISAIGDSRPPRELWSRQVDVRANADERGPQKIKLEIDFTYETHLMLEISVAHDDQSAWDNWRAARRIAATPECYAYWGAIRLSKP